MLNSFKIFYWIVLMIRYGLKYDRICSQFSHRNFFKDFTFRTCEYGILKLKEKAMPQEESHACPSLKEIGLASY